MSAGWEVALAQIEQADLPCPVYRTARRLLDRATAAGDGFVTLKDGDLRALCQSQAEGTMRSHLIQMQAAGILNYSRRVPRNGSAEDAMIFIQFAAWDNPLPLALEDEEKMIVERSKMIDQRSFSESDGGDEEPSVEEMIDQRSNLIAQRAKMIAVRANLIDQRSFSANSLTRVHARALGRWVGNLSTTNTGKKKEPTYLPKPSQSADPPLTATQQLALGLLEDSDVGVLHEVALALVASKPVQDIYRAVDRWLPEFHAGKVGVGALKHRIERAKPSGAPTANLSAGFLVSDLFQRHRLPDEMIASPPKRNYRPDEYADIIL